MLKSWNDPIKIGDWIEDTDGTKSFILEIGASGKTFLRSLWGAKNRAYEWTTIEQIKDYYHIHGEEEKWRPEYNERYFYAHPGSKTLYDSYQWHDDDWDHNLLSRNLIFRTREEAIAAAKKMLEAIK